MYQEISWGMDFLFSLFMESFDSFLGTKDLARINSKQVIRAFAWYSPKRLELTFIKDKVSEGISEVVVVSEESGILVDVKRVFKFQIRILPFVDAVPKIKVPSTFKMDMALTLDS